MHPRNNKNLFLKRRATNSPFHFLKQLCKKSFPDRKPINQIIQWIHSVMWWVLSQKQANFREIAAKCLYMDKPHALASAAFLPAFKITVLGNIAYFAVFSKETSA